MQFGENIKQKKWKPGIYGNRSLINYIAFVVYCQF